MSFNHCFYTTVNYLLDEKMSEIILSKNLIEINNTACVIVACNGRMSSRVLWVICRLLHLYSHIPMGILFQMKSKNATRHVDKNHMLLYTPIHLDMFAKWKVLHNAPIFGPVRFLCRFVQSGLWVHNFKRQYLSF